MTADLVVRPLQVAIDAASVARIRSASLPGWPVTAEHVEAGEMRRRPEQWHVARVAVEGGEVVGYRELQEPLTGARPGRLRIRVVVDPAQRGRGIGKALYGALADLAGQAGANELIVEAQRDQRSARFLADRGFVAVHQRVETCLTLANVQPETIAHAIDRCTDEFFATGVRIATYDQLRFACPDAPRRLYELELALWPDVPYGLNGALPSYESYQHEELADPDFLPAANFVALDSSEWIALASLARAPCGLLASITGVLRPWRRHGLARWLKLHTIRFALEYGAREIIAFNDATNDAMIELNRSLGFAATAVVVRYRKELP